MQQTEISPLKGDAPRLSAFQLAHALLVCLTGFQEGGGTGSGPESSRRRVGFSYSFLSLVIFVKCI